MVRVRLDPLQPSAAQMEIAAAAICGGGVVAFPTDTFYGLAVDPRSPSSVGRLFEVKRRAPDQAIPLIAADEEQVRRQAGVMTPLAARLALRYWPGPLTLIIAASPDLYAGLHGGTNRIAVRVPAHAVARDLARAVGHPITATSANLAGAPPSSTADEVCAALGETVEMVLDAGPTPGGLPSTIIEATGTIPILVRAGSTLWDHVLEFLKERVEQNPASDVSGTQSG